ncbi:MAG: lamin tail domain-containing protein [Methanomassiliicoccales archaeon]|jgi:hypothetical protein|nr:lamin tail domain-containing protein [Methanomassiliicoccales archaeon]
MLKVARIGKRLGQKAWNLRQSKTGQMAFSLIAVIILLIASASIALISNLEEKNNNQRMSVDAIQRLIQSADKVAKQLEQEAYFLAVDAIKASVGRDENEINDLFTDYLRQYLNMTFPLLVGECQLHVRDLNVHLTFLKMSLQELYPVPIDGNTNYSTDWNGATIPAYFSLGGTYCIVANSTSGNIARNFVISRAIYLPFPFLYNRFESFSNAISGERSELENIVRYELMALVQDRILRGYGVGSKHGTFGTENILTKEDVENALNLAILLEHRKYLRTLGSSSILFSFLNRTSSNATFLLLDRNISGWIDPAELFLDLFSSREYDLNIMLAQTLYAIADMLVLRWLDYFHIIDICEFVDKIGDVSDLAVSSLVDYLFHEDVLGESITKWMHCRLENAGYPDWSYRYLNYGWPDEVIEVPGRTIMLRNDYNEVRSFYLGGSYTIDFPPLDLFSVEVWKEFAVQYKMSTCELASTLEDFVKSIACSLLDEKVLPLAETTRNAMDGNYYHSSLKGALKKALESGDLALNQAINHALNASIIIDRMGEALIDFIHMNWERIFDRSAAIDQAMKSLANTIVNEIALQSQDFNIDSFQSAVDQVYSEMKCSSTWGLRERIEESFDERVDRVISIFENVFGQLPSQSPINLLAQNLGNLAFGFVEEIPGIEDILTKVIFRLLDDIENAFNLRGDPIPIAFPEMKGFTLLAEDGSITHEVIRSAFAFNEGKIDASVLPLELENPYTIEITKPWEHTPSSGFYPNRHLTDLKNLSFSPYVTQWEVSINGSLYLSISSDLDANSLISTIPLSVNGSFAFNMTFSVTAQSGWPLMGVYYESTSTLGKDVFNFLENVWSKISGGMGLVFNIVNHIFSFTRTILSTALSYAVKAIQIFSDSLQTVFSSIVKFLEHGTNSVLSWVVEKIVSLFGELQFNLTIYGLKFIIAINPIDIALGSTKDLLKITSLLSCGDTEFSISVRFLKIATGDYDLISNATIANGEWSLDIIIDPLMKIFNHFVEVKGLLGTISFEFKMPEITQYKQLQFSLSEVPIIGQFLSRIPLPIPGIVGSIDAGFEMKYNYPMANHVVINEYEQNPPSTDFGREWIELYNPTDYTISLSGWRIETSHGVQKLDTIGDDQILPKSHKVIVLTGQALDNGGERKFPLSECIVLLDSSGHRVDVTPWTTDFYNDDRTWQRAYDGGDRWVFKSESCGRPNGKKIITPSSPEWIRKTLWDAAAQTFSELSLSSTDLNALGTLLKKILHNITERCIRAIGDTIIEFRIFVEIAVSDVASTVKSGFALSLVVTGDFIERALENISSIIVKAIKRIATPGISDAIGKNISSIFEDVYIRFEVFGSTGLPKLLLSAPSSGTFRFEAVIEANIPAISRVLGDSGERTRINLGVRICNVPGLILSPLFSTGTEKNVDIWIFKICLFPQGV